MPLACNLISSGTGTHVHIFFMQHWYVLYSEEGPWYELLIIPLRFELLCSIMIPISIKGPEVPRALSKKSKRPKSKKLPTETKVTPPKPTEGSEQSHSVSSGTVPDPQDLERNIQLASTGLPSTLNEGTRKSQPLLEGSLGDKDLGGNKPPADMEPINPPVADLLGIGAKYQTSSEVKSDTDPVKLQTFGDVQAFLLSEDELDEEEILAVGEDMVDDTQVAEEVRTPSPNRDQPEPSNAQESASDSSSPDLKKYDNTLPLTER
ncbi:hypothetical protein Tco_1186468 [Tanacetum coccineum]